MTPAPLPRIPRPSASVWRQVRSTIVPPVVFAAVLGITIWLWGRNLANPLMMGTAEGLEADVSSPKAAQLAELLVTDYQSVQAGDVIAIVTPVDPAALSNKLAVIRAEMDVLRSDPGFDGGDRVRFTQVQLDWQLQRADLAVLRVRLQFAETEFQRVAKLLEQKIASTLEYDLARRNLEEVKVLVDQKTAAAEAAEHALIQLNPTNMPTDSLALRAALTAAEGELRLAEAELKPLVLTAPITGVISRIAKFAGATVGVNEPIVTIASPVVDRIIGYIPQPVRIEPHVGMEVEVRSRGLNRTVAHAQILHVSPRIELFDAPLRVRGMASAQERGLPIVMTVPATLKLRPGELVELALNR